MCDRRGAGCVCVCGGGGGGLEARETEDWQTDWKLFLVRAALWKFHLTLRFHIAGARCTASVTGLSNFGTPEREPHTYFSWVTIWPITNTILSQPNGSGDTELSWRNGCGNTLSVGTDNGLGSTRQDCLVSQQISPLMSLLVVKCNISFSSFELSMGELYGTLTWPDLLSLADGRVGPFVQQDLKGCFRLCVFGCCVWRVKATLPYTLGYTGR